MGKELRMGCNRRIGKCKNNCIETGEEMKTPNSTELLEMAHREWKNRQERKGVNET
jgi:Na+-translocating ferredoxin:NAD+ oxidoreductase RNF subunit RnfB